MTGRKNFKFYRSYFDVAQELPDKDKLQFIMALVEYQFTGKHRELKGMAKLAFISQKHSIDAQLEGYLAKAGVTVPPSIPPSEGGSIQYEISNKEINNKEIESSNINIHGAKGHFFIVEKKYVSDRLQKVFEDGVKDFFAANASICNHPDSIASFCKKNNGAKFNDFMHVFNSLNAHAAKNGTHTGARPKAFDINKI